MRLTLEELANIAKHHLVPILQETLHSAVERHIVSLGLGSSNHSFGNDAWVLPAGVFKERCQEDAFPFELETGSGCVLIHSGYRLRHHKVGSSVTDNIQNAFPKGAKAAAREWDQSKTQTSIFDFLPEKERSSFSSDEIVLAFMANPEDGLAAAYMCTIGDVRDGKIAQWDQTIELWRLDGGLDIPGTPSEGPVEPPVESPTLRVVRKKKTEE